MKSEPWTTFHNKSSGSARDQYFVETCNVACPVAGNSECSEAVICYYGNEWQ
jgi:hypothetical protein